MAKPWEARGEYHSPITSPDTLHDTMAASAATLAQNMNARCILAFSVSGATLRALSSARTGVPVYGAVVDESVLRRLLLHCGLSLVTAPRTDDLDPLITTQIARLKTDGAAVPGDRVVIIASRQDPGTRQSHHLQLAILD